MQTVLFTDMVASTDRLQQVGDAAWVSLLGRHHDEIRSVLDQYGGVEVDTAGDGFFAVFDAPALAVRAACAAIERVAALGLHIRAGVHTGEVELDASGVTGVAVHLGARVMARAQADEVLVSSTVRDVLAGSELRFIDRGSHELKGFADQWRLYVVDIESVRDRSDASTAAESPTALASSPSGKGVLKLPRLLMGAPTVDYVGRDVLLDRLHALWAEATSGTCRAVFLAGEPGVGKTRTAAELAQTAFSSGAIVLYGRCDEEAAIPYQPFVEALDWYVDHATAPALGRYAGDLDRLDPLLRRRVSRLPPRIVSDPRFEEYLLFEATRSWLVELSRRQPLVLVIDDLHWASKPVLLMLMHVLRGAMAEDDRARFLVIGTYRTGELGSADPIAIMLGDLQRLPVVTRTNITGLSLSEVEVFVARAAGQELDEDGRRLSQLIHAETDGNPFFVGEVLRHLAESEAVQSRDQRWIVPNLTRLSVPDSVKDLIRRRVIALSAAARQALTTAAVVGRDFDLEILEAVTSIPDHQLVDAMEEAARARLVEEAGGGWYRFAHALVRGALVEELSQVRRTRFHHAIGTALERVHPTDVTSLAHHFAEAGTGRGDRLRAVEYGLAAAGQALEARALADAEARYRVILDLVEPLGPEQERERVQALCGLGEAQRDQGNSDFRNTLLTAARCSRDLRDVPLLTRAVLANSRGLPSVIGAIDADRVALTEAALDLIDSRPSAEHARLLANLAAEIAFGGDDQRRLAVSDAAEQMARSLNDDRLLAWVLNRTGYAAFSPKRVEALVERAEEATRLSDALGDAAEQVLGRYYLSGALLTSGQIERFRAVTEDMLTIATNAPPLIQWFALIMQARVALLEGRFEDAQRTNDDALERAQQLGEDDAVNWWASIAVQLEMLRGGLDTVVDAVGTYVQAYPDLVAWRLMHVIALCFTGRLEDAKAAVARRPLDAEALTDDVFPFLASASACLISFHLHARPLAERLAATLEPHAAWWAHPYTTVAGPVSCWLALAICEAGDATRAVTLMERADADLSSCGGKGLLPLMRLHFAEILRQRGAESDHERALALLDLVRQDATEIGAPALASRADALASLVASQQAGP